MKKLRLEYIEAGSLAENPANWRRHPVEQTETLKDLLKDPEVGWAGACLYNERTGRLIDGHARRNAVTPDTPIPVLIGSWSEEAERKILATLDPLAAMAQGDADAYTALIQSVTTDSLWVRDALHNTRAALLDQVEEEDDAKAKDDPLLPEMELQPFEHYDYIVLLFRTSHDFEAACEKLGVKKVQIKYPGGQSKVGIGRCVDGVGAIELLQGQQFVKHQG